MVVDFMDERWRVAIDNSPRKGGDWSQAEGDIAALVDDAKTYEPTVTLVTASGAWVLPRQFSQQCVPVLQHIANLHNGMLQAHDL